MRAAAALLAAQFLLLSLRPIILYFSCSQAVLFCNGHSVWFRFKANAFDNRGLCIDISTLRKVNSASRCTRAALSFPSPAIPTSLFPLPTAVSTAAAGREGQAQGATWISDSNRETQREGGLVLVGAKWTRGEGGQYAGSMKGFETTPAIEMNTELCSSRFHFHLNFGKLAR